MRIIEDEDLIDNTIRMGQRLRDNLLDLAERHPAIGDVRGCGLFYGAELVADRDTREPLPEARVQAVVAKCMEMGVIIGATNRSLPGLNNTSTLSPALIATESDIDAVTSAIDTALAVVGMSAI